MTIIHLILCTLLACISTLHGAKKAKKIRPKPPKLTVVIVVDQLAEYVYSMHKEFLEGGFRTLAQGTYFAHAYHPHSLPETATGHAMISTGAYAHKHGLVANEWVQPDGVHLNACDDLDKRTARVFAPTDKTGKSARAIMTETLACCCRKKNAYNVIAISLKSRAAIPLAGPKGLAIWFDTKGGVFTSSKAFCKQLPPFVTAINKHLHQTLHQQGVTHWTPCFPADAPQYKHVNANIYNYAGTPFSLIDHPQQLLNAKGKPYYYPFEQTPQASEETFSLAYMALKDHFKRARKKPLVLFISLSNLDYAGHYYGPYSKEIIDTLYAIDKQLDAFMKKVTADMGKNNTLWVLTADHGVSQMPEVVSEQGYPSAQRLDAEVITSNINRILYDKYDVKNLFYKIVPPHFYVDQDKWMLVDDDIQKEIIKVVKQYFESINGIKRAWHKSDLMDPLFGSRYDKRDKALWFATQYMPGRSGDFIVEVEPFTQISTYPKGTCHASPYDQDIRVPLFFYGPGIANKVHTTQASMRHLAPTLAYLLRVPTPKDAPKEHWGDIVLS